jgi:hypothetical protein
MEYSDPLRHLIGLDSVFRSMRILDARAEYFGGVLGDAQNSGEKFRLKNCRQCELAIPHGFEDQEIRALLRFQFFHEFGGQQNSCRPRY